MIRPSRQLLFLIEWRHHLLGFYLCIEMALWLVMAGIFNLIRIWAILRALPAVILGLLTSPGGALYVVLLFVVANQLGQCS